MTDFVTWGENFLISFLQFFHWFLSHLVTIFWIYVCFCILLLGHPRRGGLYKSARDSVCRRHHSLNQ